MGYDVHIIRATDWVDALARPITFEEWIDYVHSDKEMRLDDVGEARTTDDDLFCPGRAVWTAWPNGSDGGGLACFHYRNGQIVVKNPDPSILMKMCAVAEALGAHVQGDEGEPYTVAEVRKLEETWSRPRRTRATRPWWRRVFGR